MAKTLHTSFHFKRCQYGLLILLGCMTLVSCRHREEEIRILFTGDILLSRQVKKEYDYRNESPWKDLKPLFHAADLVIGNLEGAVGTVSEPVAPSGSPIFAINGVDIALLSEAGFNVIGIENNHSYDLGHTGKQNTITRLLENGIHPICFENSPYFISVNGLVLSIVTVNIVPGANYSENPMYSLELKQKLRLARSLANMVVVSIHWGSELLEWTDKTQREAAKWLIAQGVDVIIGSHPHIIQKPDIIDGKPVFFSLGNHLFDQKYPATKRGLIVEITVKNGKYRCAGIITNTASNSFYPKPAESVSFDFPAFTYNSNLFNINGYSLIPVSVFERNESRVVLEAYRDNLLKWRSHPMPLTHISSAKLDGNEEYILALQNYYSTIDKEVDIRPYVYAVDSHGMYSKWRGSALAYPLLDARISPYNSRVLCALHRSDSYIALDKKTTHTRIAAYEWNGFGFSGLPDSAARESCEDVF